MVVLAGPDKMLQFHLVRMKPNVAYSSAPLYRPYKFIFSHTTGLTITLDRKGQKEVIPRDLFYGFWTES